MSELEPWPNPHDWQRYVNALLSQHHSAQGTVYQPVPDTTHGDAGLEGYSNDGHGYQAYADVATCTHAERTRKQKEKIATDLQKLETYKDFWRDLLGDCPLRFWTLMVPDLADKSVLKYAEAEAKKLRQKGMPHIDPNFRTFVRTHHDFPIAKAWIDRNHMAIWPFRPFEPTDDDIRALRTDKPRFQQNVERKVRTVYAKKNEQQVQGVVDNVLTYHLRGTDLLEQLRIRMPALWERIIDHDAVMEKNVAATSEFSTEAPTHRILATQKEYVSSLESATNRTLSDEYKNRLGWGIIGRWLGNCPLEFIDE